MTRRWLSLLAVGLALGLVESRAAGGTESGGGVRRVVIARSAAVYLAPLDIEMGSTEPDLVAALVRCKREALPDRCDETTFANESPPHREHVAGFWIARNEVTVADYARCVAVGRCAPAGYAGGAVRFERPNFPVTFVTYDDARRYCAFRGGRLPSEAEFERAARGAERRVYPWGNNWSARLANHGRLGVDTTDASDGFAELAPVGAFPNGATPEGVLDLAGNVAEWTLDPYGSTYGSPSPRGERVVRGGGFDGSAAFLRGAARAGKLPQSREPALGFRCVWAVKPLSD
jgi:formylglycine-generating enzyme required for sulfatase activity